MGIVTIIKWDKICKTSNSFWHRLETIPFFPSIILFLLEKKHVILEVRLICLNIYIDNVARMIAYPVG